MTRFFIAASFVTVASLFAGWAHADEAPAQTCKVVQSECSERPLENGRPGETVKVCERAKLVCELPNR